MRSDIKPIATTKTAPWSGIFLHLFKCGGSSVHDVVRPYSNLHVSHGMGPYVIQNRPHPHYEYGMTDWGAADFVWAFVRNPFDRIASLQYIFNRRHGGRYPMDKFLDLCELPGMVADRSEGINSVHEIWTHTRPYHWFPLEAVDYFGKIEEIDTVWDRVKDRLDIDDPLPVSNKSNRPHAYRDYFTVEQMNRTYRLYQEDFERFEYGW